jgi:hypothetical protein
MATNVGWVEWATTNWQVALPLATVALPRVIGPTKRAVREVRGWVANRLLLRIRFAPREERELGYVAGQAVAFPLPPVVAMYGISSRPPRIFDVRLHGFACFSQHRRLPPSAERVPTPLSPVPLSRTPCGAFHFLVTTSMPCPTLPRASSTVRTRSLAIVGGELQT